MTDYAQKTARANLGLPYGAADIRISAATSAAALLDVGEIHIAAQNSFHYGNASAGFGTMSLEAHGGNADVTIESIHIEATGPRAYARLKDINLNATHTDATENDDRLSHVGLNIGNIHIEAHGENFAQAQLYSFNASASASGNKHASFDVSLGDVTLLAEAEYATATAWFTHLDVKGSNAAGYFDLGNVSLHAEGSIGAKAGLYINGSNQSGEGTQEVSVKDINLTVDISDPQHLNLTPYDLSLAIEFNHAKVDIGDIDLNLYVADKAAAAHVYIGAQYNNIDVNTTYTNTTSITSYSLGFTNTYRYTHPHIHFVADNFTGTSISIGDLAIDASSGFVQVDINHVGWDMNRTLTLEGNAHALINLSGFAGDTGSNSTEDSRDYLKSGLVFGNLDLTNFNGNLTISQHAMVTSFATSENVVSRVAYSGLLDADHLINLTSTPSTIPHLSVFMHPDSAGHFRFIYNDSSATTTDFFTNFKQVSAGRIGGVYNTNSYLTLLSDLQDALAISNSNENIHYAYAALDVDGDGSADIGILAVDGDHKGISELIILNGLGAAALTQIDGKSIGGGYVSEFPEAHARAFGAFCASAELAPKGFFPFASYTESASTSHIPGYSLDVILRLSEGYARSDLPFAVEDFRYDLTVAYETGNIDYAPSALGGTGGTFDMAGGGGRIGVEIRAYASTDEAPMSEVIWLEHMGVQASTGNLSLQWDSSISGANATLQEVSGNISAIAEGLSTDAEVGICDLTIDLSGADKAGVELAIEALAIGSGSADIIIRDIDIDVMAVDTAYVLNNVYAAAYSNAVDNNLHGNAAIIVNNFFINVTATSADWGQADVSITGFAAQAGAVGMADSFGRLAYVDIDHLAIDAQGAKAAFVGVGNVEASAANEGHALIQFGNISLSASVTDTSGNLTQSQMTHGLGNATAFISGIQANGIFGGSAAIDISQIYIKAHNAISHFADNFEGATGQARAGIAHIIAYTSDSGAAKIDIDKLSIYATAAEDGSGNANNSAFAYLGNISVKGERDDSNSRPSAQIDIGSINMQANGAQGMVLLDGIGNGNIDLDPLSNNAFGKIHIGEIDLFASVTGEGNVLLGGVNVAAIDNAEGQIAIEEIYMHMSNGFKGQVAIEEIAIELGDAAEATIDIGNISITASAASTNDAFIRYIRAEASFSAEGLIDIDRIQVKAVSGAAHNEAKLDTIAAYASGGNATISVAEIKIYSNGADADAYLGYKITTTTGDNDYTFTGGGVMGRGSYGGRGLIDIGNISVTASGGASYGSANVFNISADAHHGGQQDISIDNLNVHATGTAALAYLGNIEAYAYGEATNTASVHIGQINLSAIASSSEANAEARIIQILARASQTSAAAMATATVSIERIHLYAGGSSSALAILGSNEAAYNGIQAIAGSGNAFVEIGDISMTASGSSAIAEISRVAAKNTNEGYGKAYVHIDQINLSATNAATSAVARILQVVAEASQTFATGMATVSIDHMYLYAEGDSVATAILGAEGIGISAHAGDFDYGNNYTVFDQPFGQAYIHIGDLSITARGSQARAKLEGLYADASQSGSATVDIDALKLHAFGADVAEALIKEISASAGSQNANVSIGDITVSATASGITGSATAHIKNIHAHVNESLSNGHANISIDSLHLFASGAYASAHIGSSNYHSGITADVTHGWAYLHIGDLSITASGLEADALLDVVTASVYYGGVASVDIDHLELHANGVHKATAYIGEIAANVSQSSSISNTGFAKVSIGDITVSAIASASEANRDYFADAGIHLISVSASDYGDTSTYNAIASMNIGDIFIKASITSTEPLEFTDSFDERAVAHIGQSRYGDAIRVLASDSRAHANLDIGNIDVIAHGNIEYAAATAYIGNMSFYAVSSGAVDATIDSIKVSASGALNADAYLGKVNASAKTSGSVHLDIGNIDIIADAGSQDATASIYSFNANAEGDNARANIAIDHIRLLAEGYSAAAATFGYHADMTNRGFEVNSQSGANVTIDIGDISITASGQDARARFNFLKVIADDGGGANVHIDQLEINALGSSNGDATIRQIYAWASASSNPGSGYANISIDQLHLFASGESASAHLSHDVLVNEVLINKGISATATYGGHAYVHIGDLSITANGITAAAKLGRVRINNYSSGTATVDIDHLALHANGSHNATAFMDQITVYGAYNNLAKLSIGEITVSAIVSGADNNTNYLADAEMDKISVTASSGGYGFGHVSMDIGDIHIKASIDSGDPVHFDHAYNVKAIAHLGTSASADAIKIVAQSSAFAAVDIGNIEVLAYGHMTSADASAYIGRMKFEAHSSSSGNHNVSVDANIDSIRLSATADQIAFAQIRDIYLSANEAYVNLDIGDITIRAVAEGGAQASLYSLEAMANNAGSYDFKMGNVNIEAYATQGRAWASAYLSEISADWDARGNLVIGNVTVKADGLIADAEIYMHVYNSTTVTANEQTYTGNLTVNINDIHLTASATNDGNNDRFNLDMVIEASRANISIGDIDINLRVEDPNAAGRFYMGAIIETDFIFQAGTFTTGTSPSTRGTYSRSHVQAYYLPGDYVGTSISMGDLEIEALEGYFQVDINHVGWRADRTLTLEGNADMLINLSGFAGDTSTNTATTDGRDYLNSGLVFGNLDLTNFNGNLTIAQHALVTNYHMRSTTNTSLGFVSGTDLSGLLDADYMAYTITMPQIWVNMNAGTGAADNDFRFIFNHSGATSYTSTTSSFTNFKYVTNTTNPSGDGMFADTADLWNALRDALAINTTSSNIHYAYGVLDYDSDGNADIGVLAVDGDHKGITELIYFDGLGHQTLTQFSAHSINPGI